MSEIYASDSYKSISKHSSGVHRELGSKFLSFAFPVSTEREIKDIISNLKKEFFDASHHCYAYRLGFGGETWRANDDGEPSSSAGRPILGQLLSNDLSDILIVVIRYFGGTKLGIPGLIRSYKNAAADAINNSEIVTKISCGELVLNFDYASMGQVMRQLKSHGAEIINQLSDNRCTINIKIRKGGLYKLSEALGSIEGVILEEITEL
jgi:uncharacterized YigZ family protein